MPTITDINDIFLWFQQLDKPSQEQFVNTLWSFRHKNDSIGIEDLTEELQDILNSATTNKGLVVLAPGTTSWASAKGTFIDDIVFVAEDGADEFNNCSIGTTEYGSEIIENIDVSNYFGLFPIKHYSKVNETIYFTNVANNFVIKLYIK
jgi:hypothetical protein